MQGILLNNFAQFYLRYNSTVCLRNLANIDAYLGGMNMALVEKKSNLQIYIFLFLSEEIKSNLEYTDNLIMVSLVKCPLVF